MSEKEMISSKMASRTAKRLKEYAEREGISKSQAVENMVRQGLDVEESDMRLVPVKTDGGTEMEQKLESVEEKIDSRRQFRRLMDMTLIIAVAWIAIQLSVGGLGPLLSALTGIPLMLSLVYTFYKSGVRP
jgi:hypothetical protein